MQVYYAHCTALYNTKQEQRDVELLQKLDYNVLNPNHKTHQELCKQRENVMEYFFRSC